MAAAYAAERPLFLDSFLKLKIRGFKSRAAYDGARTVYIFATCCLYCVCHSYNSFDTIEYNKNKFCIPFHSLTYEQSY